MSTLSTVFSLVLATTSDTVSVVGHIANNFASLDSIIGQEHQGTGEHKASLALTTPTLINPAVSGTLSGGLMVTASTGAFSTITATGGVLKINSLTVGTCPFPTTASAAGTVLTVSGTRATWLATTTGASLALNNLASVAINTSLQNFTASQVTVDVIKATAGTFSGLTSIVSTTGTFSANLTVAGTLNAGIVNCTAGSITAGSVKATALVVGTYSYPGTVGATGQVLSVTTGNLAFSTLTHPISTYSIAGAAGGTGTTAGMYMLCSNTVACPNGAARATYEFTPFYQAGTVRLICSVAAGGGAATGTGWFSLNGTTIGEPFTFAGTTTSTSIDTVVGIGDYVGFYFTAVNAGTSTNFQVWVAVPSTPQALTGTA